MLVKVMICVNSEDVAGLEYNHGSYYIRTEKGSEIIIDEALIARLIALRDVEAPRP